MIRKWLAGQQSEGLRARTSPSQALTQLLSGSGYRALAQGGNQYRLEPNPKSGAVEDAVQALPTVVVSAMTLTHPGMLPPEHAGGQIARGGRLGVLGNRDLMDTPFSQTSYARGLMESQQARLLTDVLDNDSSAQSTNPTTGHDAINIRGFLLGNGLAHFNGLPGVLPGTLSSIPTESLERIEVFKGPNTMLSGAVTRGVGGMINLAPKRAGDEPLTRLTADYTSTTQVGGHVDIGRRFGPTQE